MGYPFDSWSGKPRALANPWALTKGQHRAYCFIVAHPEGAELRVEADGRLLRKDVCRTVDAALMRAAAWREQLTLEGWTPL